MMYFRWFFSVLFLWLLTASLSLAEVDEKHISEMIIPPYSLGEKTEKEGVWKLLNGAGLENGFVIQSELLAPIPGFSGRPINILILLDLNGSFIDVKLIEHNEPIFVSGIGNAPFHEFVKQYRGHSIRSSLSVGTPYGSKAAYSSLVYLDGVTKATASVRIAHETIIAAAREVVKTSISGLGKTQEVHPNLEHEELLTWDMLVTEGIAKHLRVSNNEVQEKYKGTRWEFDDPKAIESPDQSYIDLWLVDLGHPSIAAAIFKEETISDLQVLKNVAAFDTPFLLIETARHGLYSDIFIRNTSPDSILVTQDELPISVRDADLFIDFKLGVPKGRSMILRVDRRLGFDPTKDWQVSLIIERSHGTFLPEIGTVSFPISYKIQPRFYSISTPVKTFPAWVIAVQNRRIDILLLCVFLIIVICLMLFQKWVVSLRYFTSLRLLILAGTVGFIGWWGQGQLSIVTVMASLRSFYEGKSLSYLLYDPFSLIIWIITLLSFFVWGRALFCGWLCPFGALQEWISSIGKWFKFPQIKLSNNLDNYLKYSKYIILFSLIFVTFMMPDNIDKAAEIEPFKTAISVTFNRNLFYVGYALLCLLSSAFIYKSYCRYFCPLGAVMAIGGFLRQFSWIKRRDECGTPCQFCKVKCSYNAIKPSGEIKYSECFGCLDCVSIFNEPSLCVAEILARKKRRKI